MFNKFSRVNKVNKVYLVNDYECLEDLKKDYRVQALKLHPDKGGSIEEMQMLNAEYEELFKKYKNLHKNKDGKVYEKENTEKASEFIDIIYKLLKLDGLNIEVCGCFLWITGDTKKYHKELKAMGLRFSGNKQAWYLSPKDYKRWSKRKWSLDDIRVAYGSVTIKKQDNNQTSQKQLTWTV